MSAVSKIEETRLRIARRYETWLSELNDLRERHLNSLGYVGSDSVYAALEETISFTRMELEEIADRAFDAAAQEGSSASKEVEMPALQNMREEMSQAIVTGLTRDVSTLTQGMAADAIRFKRLSTTMGASVAKSVIRGAVFGLSAFRQVDAAGRRMKSSAFVPTAVRGCIYDAYLHAFLSGALELGSLICTAHHPENEDVSISLPDFDTWAADEIHPNSRWEFTLGVPT